MCSVILRDKSIPTIMEQLEITTRLNMIGDSEGVRGRGGADTGMARIRSADSGTGVFYCHEGSVMAVCAWGITCSK